MNQDAISLPVPRPDLLRRLSPEVQAALLTSDAMQLPWDAALLLLDTWDRDGDLETALSAIPWLDVDSAEALTDALLDARLPRRGNLRLRLRAVGTYGRAGYHLEADWEDDDGRPVPAPAIEGGLARSGGDVGRLTAGQLGLLRTLAELPAIYRMGEGHQTADLEATLRAKQAVPPGDPGVRFDPFLEREEITRVAAIQPRFARTRDGWQVRPHAEGVPDKPLEDYCYRTPGPRLGSPTTVPRGTERQRVVFEDRAARGLRQLRKVDRVDGAELARVLTDPSSAFGPDVDVSGLSERVIGLGPVVQRAIPILRETEAQSWWDWEAVEEGAPEGPAIPPLDKATATALAGAIAQADREGVAYVAHPSRPDVLLQVDEALRRAVEEAAEPDRPRPPTQPRVGLLVRENLETESFNRAGGAPVLTRESLPRPPNLDPNAALLPHQVEGAAWLHAVNQPGDAWCGALLADDMGLGKTLQVLCHLDGLLRSGRPGPHLVVAPVALITTWQEEARRWFGAAFEPVLPIEGGSKALPDDSAAAAARMAAQRLVLVSYESLRRRELAFARVSWDTVVCDEAQKAKDPSTQVHRVLKTLKARFRLAVTGTPVENGLRELWALYDFALPGLLGTLRDFNARFIKPVAEGSSEERVETAARLHRAMTPWYMRRMKQAVLGDRLPPIACKDHPVELSNDQRARYNALISTRDTAPLATLTRLFAICAHPSMADDGPLPALEDKPFPKASALVALLDSIHEKGEKALIFARRKRVQRWLADTVERRFGVSVAIINGDVPSSRERFGRIQAFEAARGFGALVLAPRAAGVGLTITAANHVIHYMREWNPAVEQQATDRVYRIGQERPVTVYTLTTVSDSGRTVEEVLRDLLAEKRRLMDDFVVPLGGFDLDPSELFTRWEQTRR